MYKLINILMAALLAAFTGFSSLSYAAALSSAVMTNNASIPPSVIDSADPNVMINLSIERPMIGAAYNDQDDDYNPAKPIYDPSDPASSPPGSYCTGRDGSVGICYVTNKDYLGYFNPRLCYNYTGGIFAPTGATAADHSCSGNWSGNFLNWATMTAVDEFRLALTGGHRSTDSAGTTVLERANMVLNAGNSKFPYKRISTSNASPYNVAPGTVTPYSGSTIYIFSDGIQFGVSSSKNTSANLSGRLNVRAQVCDGTIETSASTYRNCVRYGVNLKPEGLIQKNANNMRFAVMSYLLDDSPDRDGGVLRARMKYVGKFSRDSAGSIIANPGQEISDVDGTFPTNPDATDASDWGVSNSGVINYINKFGSNGYKSLDPVGELFYECLNYFKHRGPTSDYTAGISPGDAELDGFPAITDWDAANYPVIQNACQENYIVAINDANPWYDKRLPGTAVTAQTMPEFPDTEFPPADHDFNANKVIGSHRPQDYGEPSNSDTDINVTYETYLVGAMQDTRQNGPMSDPANGSIVKINQSNQLIGCVENDCDMQLSSKLIQNLGKAFGTAPEDYKQNSYYIAGLAYYAASNDMNTTFDGMQTINTFMIDTQEYKAAPLVGEMNMLWLAGKYGGFNEKNFVTNTTSTRDYWPDAANEWDEDGDGVPDNYIKADDPNKLIAGLNKAFSNIEQRISSGSAAAVIADGVTGTGAFYQAIYSPRFGTATGDEVQWVGQLHALFIDPLGRLREDGSATPSNGVLDDIATDNIVRLRFNPAKGIERTQVYRYASQAAFDSDTPSATVEVDDLRAIWKAREALAVLDDDKIEEQRTYDTPISTSGASRHILTWKDTNGDRVVDTGELVNFVAANMDENIMAVATDSEADAVVAFVRGKEDITGYSGFRSRTIDYDGDGSDEYWRLGDIIHSSPVVVGRPSEAYDVLKNDATYADFRAQYTSRRQVVYVGGNDGMLHAFNAGFFDAGANTFNKTRPAESYESTAPKSHPLGAELWGYVPGNLLPHLQWLKEQNYPHLYYVDGSPQVFDVNIFDESNADYPNGWGTILVVNMRFGGGEVSYDHDGDGGSGTADITARSAVVVLDITNPERAPRLLAEISDANLGFTTSRPTLVVQRDAGADNDFSTFSGTEDNNWYLAFGSGPAGSNALTAATSDQNARMYYYDLKSDALTAIDLGITNAFVGDVASQNWNSDFMDDAVYYGTVEGTVVAPSGNLYRIPVSGSVFGSPFPLLSPLTNQPFTSAPAFTTDVLTGDHWVYAGTGRLYVNNDNQSATQQTFYGVKEPSDGSSWPSVTITDLQDVTGLRVFQTGDMEDPAPKVIPLGVLGSSTISGTNITTDTDTTDFSRFRTYMNSKEGWFINFALSSNSTRNLFSAATFRSFVIFPEYTPPLDQCVPEGTSRLYALFSQTGTAFPSFGLGENVPQRANTNNDDYETAGVTQSIQGLVSTPVIYQSPGGTGTGGGSGKIIACSSTAACTDDGLTPVPTSGGRRSWRELP